MKFQSLRALVGALLMAMIVAGFGENSPARAGNEAERQHLIFGRISSYEDQAKQSLGVMTGYLRRHMPDAAEIDFGEVVVASLPEMIELLKAGKVDVISETPFGAIELEREAGASLVLHEWKKGVAEYASMLISYQGSGINSLEDLRGKVLALEDPGSTSGFLLPLAAIRARGIKCVELMDRSQTPPADAVGYFFAGHEINIASLVARHIVDAGAISDLNWRDETEVPSGFRERLKMLYQTSFVPRSLVLVRRGLPDEMKAKLQAMLLAMHSTAEGRITMHAYHGVKRFEAPTEKFRQQMAMLRDQRRIIEGLIHP